MHSFTKVFESCNMPYPLHSCRCHADTASRPHIRTRQKVITTPPPTQGTLKMPLLLMSLQHAHPSAQGLLPARRLQDFAASSSHSPYEAAVQGNLTHGPPSHLWLVLVQLLRQLLVWVRLDRERCSHRQHLEEERQIVPKLLQRCTQQLWALLQVP